MHRRAPTVYLLNMTGYERSNPGHVPLLDTVEIRVHFSVRDKIGKLVGFVCIFVAVE